MRFLKRWVWSKQKRSIFDRYILYKCSHFGQRQRALSRHSYSAHFRYIDLEDGVEHFLTRSKLSSENQLAKCIGKRIGFHRPRIDKIGYH